MKRPTHSRISRLKTVLAELDCAAYLVTRREDVRYLSGFTGSAGCLLVSGARVYLITDFRYKLQAARETKGISIVIQKTDAGTALQAVTERIGAGNICFDESAITVEELKKLRKKRLSLKGSRDIVGPLRKLKDGDELANIRLAVSRAEQSFRELKNFIKPGIRERELGQKLDYLMRVNGSRKAAFDTIVASGANGAMPHASVTNRRLRKGDLVTFDFGAEANGYYSDMTRTYCMGRPSARQRRIHELVLKAQTAAMRSIRPGVTCKSVDDGARSLIHNAGHREHFGHGTGHGIGLMVHEAPSISPRSDDWVAKDMVFTVEPGVYIPGWGGVRIEDMVQVTKKGAKIVTSLPRELEGLRSL
jgi:Xaa-Pro aminopeptidase